MTPRHTCMTRVRPVLGALLAIPLLLAGGCAAKDAAPGVTTTLRSAAIPRPGGEPMPAYDEGTASRAVVMSHGGSGTKEDFVGIAAAFARAGWRVVAYDAGTDRRSDLRDVVSYARASGAAEVVLLGGSLGATLSLAMAEELDAAAVVALSPPSDSFDVLTVAPRLRMPLLLVAAEDNAPFDDTTRALAAAARVQPLIVSGSRHGSGMFRDHPELVGQVTAFAGGSVPASP